MNCQWGRKFFIIAALLAAVLDLPGASESGNAYRAGAESAFAQKSPGRVERLRNSVIEYGRAIGLDDHDFKIQRAILSEFEEYDDVNQNPLDPPLNERIARQKARENADTIIAKRFPPLDVDKLRSEAEEMYPTYKIGDVVEVTYQANPLRRATVRDIYRGRSDQALRIGITQILIKDIQAVPGNQDLLLKFDIPQSQRLRQTYVTTQVRMHEDRKNIFAEKVYEVALEQELQDIAKMNERIGYVVYNAHWHTIRGLVPLILAGEREKEARATALAAALPSETTSPSTVIKPIVSRPVQPPLAKPEPELADTGAAAPAETTMPPSETETKDKVTGSQATEGDEPSPRPDDSLPEAAEQVEQLETAEAAPAPAPAVKPAAVVTPAADGSGFLPKLAALLAVVLAAAGAAFKIYKNSKPRGQFCISRGAVERDFWSMAEQNRVDMKFVAYKYPTARTARDALYSLSFLIETHPNGPFTAGPPIFIGLYQEEDDYIALVGGKALNYPMWKEAKFRFAQFAEGIEFKVSDPPHKDVKIPDHNSLATKAVAVEHLETTGGGYEDFSIYHKYRAPDEATAEKFLKLVSIYAPGTYIIVETPNGNWGKDIDGIYQE